MGALNALRVPVSIDDPMAWCRRMSLFPDRDWPFVKAKLKRLPARIFLPKPQAAPASEAASGSSRTKADYEGGQGGEPEPESGVAHGPGELGPDGLPSGSEFVGHRSVYGVEVLEREEHPENYFIG